MLFMRKNCSCSLSAVVSSFDSHNMDVKKLSFVFGYLCNIWIFFLLLSLFLQLFMVCNNSNFGLVFCSVSNSRDLNGRKLWFLHLYIFPSRSMACTKQSIHPGGFMTREYALKLLVLLSFN